MTITPRGEPGPGRPAALRWRGWARRVRPATNRWRAWAVATAGRHAPPSRARPAPRMTFLEPGRAAGVTGGSRQAFISAPRLQLAVHPVLVVPGRRGRRDGGPVTVLHRWHAPQGAGPSPGGRAGGRRTAARRTPTTGAALQLVQPVPTATRAAGPGEGPAWRRWTTDDLVARVVRGHRRIERHARGAAVVRERQDVAAEVERRLATVQQHAPGPHAGPPAAGAAWPALDDLDAPAPVDLERLTDQIMTRLDNRLTAYKERFGRVF